jgi:hypothetical protein
MNPDLVEFRVPNLVSLGPYNPIAADSLHDKPDAPDALLIANNAMLASFVFPNLTTIQDTLQVMNNEKIQCYDAFPLLNSITGDILFSQNFDL